MAATYKFVNEQDVADGSGEYDLDDGTNTFVFERGIVGMGQPALDVQAQRRAGMVGSELQVARITRRVVGIPILIVGSSVNDTQDRLRAAVKYMTGSYGRNEPRFGQLRITPNGTTERRLRCICPSAPKDYNTNFTGTQAAIAFTFYADHPNWYNPTEQTSTITIGSGAGMPWQFPHNWGPDGATGGATVTNNGDAETRSLLFSVTAGANGITNPGVWNSTLEKYVRLEGLTVNDGETLKIRMGWRPDGVRDHRAVVEDSSGNETSVLGYLETNSEFFWLEPGANEIVCVQDSPTTSTQWSVGWYDEYFSI